MPVYIRESRRGGGDCPRVGDELRSDTISAVYDIAAAVEAAVVVVVVVVAVVVVTSVVVG